MNVEFDISYGATVNLECTNHISARSYLEVNFSAKKQNRSVVHRPSLPRIQFLGVPGYALNRSYGCQWKENTH